MNAPDRDALPDDRLAREAGEVRIRVHLREFTKGSLVKGGLATYAFPLCNRNALDSVVNVQIESIPNCETPLY